MVFLVEVQSGIFGSLLHVVSTLHHREFVGVTARSEERRGWTDMTTSIAL